jgi:hypothetical protein
MHFYGIKPRVRLGKHRKYVASDIVATRYIYVWPVDQNKRQF